MGVRLIDADRLMDSLRGNVLVDVTPALEEAVTEQPAAYGWIPVEEHMNLEATAMLAMSGYDVDYETRHRLLEIIHCYEMGMLVSTDCTGCRWKTDIGCINQRTCRRELLDDLYQKAG